MLLPLVVTFLVSAAPAAEEARLEDGYALTLSGGVSLGSYEAGLNWALVRVFRAKMSEMLLRRRPRLVGVTGASAGSINALLVAALYCETEESAARSSIDDNILRSAWLHVGLDALLPDDPRAYRPDDAVLASAALEPVVVEIRRALLENGLAFQPRCRLPLGLTVTRVQPLERNVGGLRVTSQRAVLPLLFDIDDQGKVRFERQPLPPASDASESRLALADAAEMGKVGVHPEVVLHRSSHRRPSRSPSGPGCSASARPRAARTPRRRRGPAPGPRALRSPGSRARRSRRRRAAAH